METRAPAALVEERDLYPIHEDDDVAEITFHERQTRYLRDALEVRFPDRLVTGNICIYWEEGSSSLYRAPDVFVSASLPSDPEPRVYLMWQDPPIVFAGEIGSRSTFAVDTGPMLDIYSEHIRAEEYLYSDPPRSDLRMWRLGPEGYAPVDLEPNGWLYSEQLGLEFGLEGEFLRIYTLDGERLRTHTEAEEEREEAEVRAAAEAQLREAAERSAAEERQQREALERRLAELQAELDRRRP